MWIERFSELTEFCNFYPPAMPEQIAALEADLCVVFPDELRGILLETNGLSVSPPGLCQDDEEDEQTCFNIVSSIEEIREENYGRHPFDEDETNGLIPPMSSLLFVASDFNGDYFAYHIVNERVPETALYRMCHDDPYGHGMEADSLWHHLHDVLTVVDKMR